MDSPRKRKTRVIFFFHYAEFHQAAMKSAAEHDGDLGRSGETFLSRAAVWGDEKFVHDRESGL